MEHRPAALFLFGGDAVDPVVVLGAGEFFRLLDC